MGEKRPGFLVHAYDLEDAESTRAFYDDWARSYDEEIRDNGYATPRRCAEALASVARDKTLPLLDLGCGTGLSGEAFREAGFTIIDGTDFSNEMLARAAARKDVYRHLAVGDLNNPLPGEPGDHVYIAAVGVFSPSHAPPSLMKDVVGKLPRDGCFVFSLNDHALDDPGYEREVERLEAGGDVEVVFREYGDHLPGKGIKALVCVLRRTGGE